MDDLREKLLHYTDDLSENVDLRKEAIATIEQAAQYMEEDVLLHHSRALALAYLALTDGADVSPERLKELAAADKDGRVVVLPCKVGDRVFVLVGYDKQIKECTVTYMYDNWALLQSIDDPEKEYGTSFVDFGKRTFFNRAEAEEAKKI